MKQVLQRIFMLNTTSSIPRRRRNTFVTPTSVTHAKYLSLRKLSHSFEILLQPTACQRSFLANSPLCTALCDVDFLHWISQTTSSKVFLQGTTHKLLIKTRLRRSWRVRVVGVGNEREASGNWSYPDNVQLLVISVQLVSDLRELESKVDPLLLSQHKIQDIHGYFIGKLGHFSIFN